MGSAVFAGGGRVGRREEERREGPFKGPQEGTKAVCEILC